MFIISYSRCVYTLETPSILVFQPNQTNNAHAFQEDHTLEQYETETVTVVVTGASVT
jgi:hypothetical protein